MCVVMLVPPGNGRSSVVAAGFQDPDRFDRTAVADHLPGPLRAGTTAR
ncbi:hypothetical protein MA5S0921_3357 [Mycobacteroides abscessus 5S-0921]|uniref:Uncharacterized protein n=3 Tax=Mycobacteroides abscessus TaxID=36809 RepID=A0A829QFZ0_9MYCO|nr:hypothetical protein MA4S0726RB_2391 [Mycobacteroides abscessus 4S-0726-RB]EIU07245.1 hypothetical protein MA5S0421_2656 [Mycobacteroides abscessus 5S-0421]EIU11586.1 hypothetical protein MA5S0304_2400 [Mycobacteroides abscessus 5S-0304]EIU38482.1 hypothetical protein MA6G0125R_2235 [Mycobacteroides abscessus 6G-0125-R]EIU44251.1 hypothetical protein MA5S1215_2438 [Mycobacteroides abscessus 5S-1215]EIU57917.1 hypothetical protein MA6G0728S_2958 [Mycobacteroides abscessus 6G-0728-S]EIU91320